MLAAPKYGFVFLAAPKAASTSIQRAFQRNAQLISNSPPPMKHMTARVFERDVAPILANYGFERSSYVITALMREPIDLVASWYRYRSRPDLEGTPRYTGDTSFDAFAEEVVAGRAGIGRPRKFYCGTEGQLLVDRLYKYEHLDAYIAWLSERVKREVTLPRLNTSGGTRPPMSEGTRRMLEEHLAVDLEMHAQAL